MSYKKWEIFREIRIPPDFLFFIRTDGRRFGKVVKLLDAEQPYDRKVAECIVSTVLSLPDEGFTPVISYIVSDEINMLFKEIPYGGRIEKILSVLSGVLSSRLTLELYNKFGRNVVVSFDARIILLPSNLIEDYIISRQKIGWNNCLVSHAAYVLRKKGFSSDEIGKRLYCANQSMLHEILMKEGGINPSKLPAWQKNGILLYRDIEGYITEWDVPLFTSPSGAQLLHHILAQYI